MSSLWCIHHLSWQGSQSCGGKLGSSAGNGKSLRSVHCISHRSIFGHTLRIFKTCICTQASSSAVCTRLTTSPINHWQQLLSRASGLRAVLLKTKCCSWAHALGMCGYTPGCGSLQRCSPACLHSTSPLFRFYLLLFAALMKKWYKFPVVFPNPTIPIDPDRFYERQDTAETHK